MKNKKLRIPKINSIDYGGKWIMTGLMIGGIIPGVVWLIFHVFLWGACIVGGLILSAFLVVFIIEMHQDNSRIPYYEKRLKETLPFNREKQVAVLRSSICTGETIAGFKSIADAHFIEVMVIKTPKDLERFKKIYGITEIKKEY